jgi:single-strand DNA-binding protein
MNKVVLIGRMAKDAELKYTPGNGTAVTSFTLAVDNPFKKDNEGNKQADFINLVAWNKTAE